MKLATCIGCGCDDDHACVGLDGACAWLAVDRRRGLGVCSSCPAELARWNRGDRKGNASAHHCHWPGCERVVPPALWGCKAHWFSLPKRLRDKIRATYRRGQEVTKDPSPEYVEAAREVQRWITEYRASGCGTGRGAHRREASAR